MTPIDPELIREANQIAHWHGAVFILDEMLSGFRAGLPGSYTEYGFEPDLRRGAKPSATGSRSARLLAVRISWSLAEFGRRLIHASSCYLRRMAENITCLPPRLPLFANTANKMWCARFAG